MIKPRRQVMCVMMKVGLKDTGYFCAIFPRFSFNDFLTDLQQICESKQLFTFHKT
jgi:hypothetical protein